MYRKYALIVLCCLCCTHSVNAKITGTLAYVSGGALWLKTLPAGKAVRVRQHVSAGKLQWSPSGQWITVGDTIIGRDGARSPARVKDYRGIVWAPRDDIFAYSRNDGGLYLMQAAEWKERRLVPAAPGPHPTDRIANGVQEFVWSPDGRQIAYTTMTVPFDSSGFDEVTYRLRIISVSALVKRRCIAALHSI